MKKIISTLAIAGLGAGLAVGAQAQTVNSTTSGLYQLTITEGAGFGTQATSGTFVGDYEYDYVVTLTSANPYGLNIDQATFDSLAGFVPGSASASNTTAATNFGLPGSFVPTTSGAIFTASNGFFTQNDQATFTLYSIYAPGSTISANFDADATGTLLPSGKSTGTPSVAPPGPNPNAITPAVPEAGSFALLGLGLLPLAFLARRRMSNNA